MLAPARHPRVLLFLDFDGVLHHFFPQPGVDDAQNRHFAFLGAFEDAVRRCPCEIEIVIASTWRRVHDLAALRALFSPDIAERIVGVTPQLGSGNGPGARLAEVRAWLERQGRQGDPWVAIDDFPELYQADDPVAIVDCQDCFGPREAALLLQAVCDPKAYARRRALSAGPGAPGGMSG